jgi:hypothetical protein
MAYAEGTSVDSSRSRAEIEKTLQRYGADGFGYMSRRTQAMIEFTMNNRLIRFVVKLPDPDERRFTHTETGKVRGNRDTVLAAYEQAIRQRWRALSLVVKAKLEAVEAGIAEFEEEFGMHVVLPDGRTVYEHTAPAIATAYETGKVSGLLQLES